jgi:PAS domain S-box-containing protein
MIGSTEAEMIGNGWLNFVHPEMRDEVWENWHESIKKEMEFNMTTTFITVDGDSFEVHSTALPIRVGSKLTGYLGFHDIVEIKQKTI